MMPHPLVTQLRFTRDEFVRGQHAAARGDVDGVAGGREGERPVARRAISGVALFVILEGAWAVVAAVALGRRLLSVGRTA